MAEINIIPLADLMLALLVVFMLATPALTRRIDRDLLGTRPLMPTAIPRRPCACASTPPDTRTGTTAPRPCRPCRR
ncbi:MAG: ExbD/TolR family protein [Luteimonas sp.]